MMRQFIQEYLSFTQKERVAVIALIAVILGVYILPRFIRQDKDLPSPQEIKEFKMLERNLGRASKGRELEDETDDDRAMMHAAVSTYEDSRPAQLFYFDPNTLDEPGWKRLGLRPKTIGTVLKYRSKGGKFYKAADLKRIYGLQSGEYERLEPYIRIVKEKTSYHDVTGREAPGSDGSNYRDKHITATNNRSEDKRTFYKRSPEPIDINTADTSAFIALPGIGSKLAARIVFFRERLGGFYDVDQLHEVYGLADSVFQKLRDYLTMSGGHIRKIDINTAGEDILKQHPYIKWNIAKAIVAYRGQHGPFKNLEQLQQVGVITMETYSRMLPYLSLGE